MCVPVKEKKRDNLLGPLVCSSHLVSKKELTSSLSKVKEQIGGSVAGCRGLSTEKPEEVKATFLCSYCSSSTNTWREQPLGDVRGAGEDMQCTFRRGVQVLGILITCFHMHMHRVELWSQADSTHGGRKLISLCCGPILPTFLRNYITSPLPSVRISEREIQENHASTLPLTMSRSSEFLIQAGPLSHTPLLPKTHSGCWRAASWSLKWKSLPRRLRISSCYCNQGAWKDQDSNSDKPGLKVGP